MEKPIEEEKEDCPECNGVGQWPLDCEDAEFMDCPYCKGTGKKQK